MHYAFEFFSSGMVRCHFCPYFIGHIKSYGQTQVYEAEIHPPPTPLAANAETCGPKHECVSLLQGVAKELEVITQPAIWNLPHGAY